MRVKIQIGELAKIIESFEKTLLKDNQEINIENYKVSIPTPTGVAPITHFIKKEKLPIIEITLSNGYTFRCAEKHILRRNNKDIFAVDLQVGNILDHRNIGKVYVSSISNAFLEDCFDISVPSPHYYYDANGVVHHNTLITAILSKQVEKYGRTIVIVPGTDLAEQTLATYKHLGLDVGIFYGPKKDWNRTHTICTWQSLEALFKKTKAGEVSEEKDIISFVEGVVAVMADESHGVRAEALGKLLCGIFRNVPIRWGLTGTIPKEEIDKLSLIGYVGEIIHGVSASELQEVDFLSQCKIEIIQSQETGKFNNFQDEYKFLTTNKQRLTSLAELYNEIAKSGNTLILVNRIETGKILSQAIPDSVFLDGSVKTENRKEEYDLIATENNKTIIATFGIAAVGLDIPRLFNVILFEPGKAFTRVIQSLGRGLRKALDKDFVNIYDSCSSTKYSKKHLTERKKYYRDENFEFHVTKVNLE